MLMIARRVGGVSGNGDASRRHDGKVRDTEFRPVLAHQHHRIARLQTLRLERRGKARDLLRHLGPAQRSPVASCLAPQKRQVAHLLRAGEEHRYQIGISFDRPQAAQLLNISASPARIRSVAAIAAPSRNGHAFSIE
jgi:hypothetical protein